MEFIERQIWGVQMLGASTEEIVEALKKSGVVMPKRTVELYLKRIREKRERDPAFTKDVIRLKDIQAARVEMFMREAFAQGKFGSIPQFEMIWARIKGTFEPIKVETIQRRGWESLTDEEIAFMKANPGKLPPGRTLEELEHIA